MRGKQAWIISDNITIAYNKINEARFEIGKRFIDEKSVWTKFKEIKKLGFSELEASKELKNRLWVELV